MFLFTTFGRGWILVLNSVLRILEFPYAACTEPCANGLHRLHTLWLQVLACGPYISRGTEHCPSYHGRLECEGDCGRSSPSEGGIVGMAKLCSPQKQGVRHRHRLHRRDPGFWALALTIGSLVSSVDGVAPVLGRVQHGCLVPSWSSSSGTDGLVPLVVQRSHLKAPLKIPLLVAGNSLILWTVTSDAITG